MSEQEYRDYLTRVRNEALEEDASNPHQVDYGGYMRCYEAPVGRMHGKKWGEVSAVFDSGPFVYPARRSRSDWIPDGYAARLDGDNAIAFRGVVKFYLLFYIHPRCSGTSCNEVIRRLVLHGEACRCLF